MDGCAGIDGCAGGGLDMPDGCGSAGDMPLLLQGCSVMPVSDKDDDAAFFIIMMFFLGVVATTILVVTYPPIAFALGSAFMGWTLLPREKHAENDKATGRHTVAHRSFVASLCFIVAIVSGGYFTYKWHLKSEAQQAVQAQIDLERAEAQAEIDAIKAKQQAEEAERKRLEAEEQRKIGAWGRAKKWLWGEGDE